MISRLLAIATSLVWQISKTLVSRSTRNNVLVVTEYPKCGGSWLAKSAASSLGLPYVGGGIFLPLISCVLRTHWKPDAALSPAVFVVRDVRDVMVSLFHHRVTNMARTPRRAAQYQQQFGVPLSTDAIGEQLKGFMEIEFSDPRYGAHLNWTEFVKAAVAVVDGGSKVAIVRYEDALEDSLRVLDAALKQLGMPPEQTRLELACQLHDASVASKGGVYLQETTFLRSAKHGGWRDVFNRDSAEFIADQCNPELMALGYIDTTDWWQQIDP